MGRASRNWGAIHERLVPGFVVDTRLDGADRIVTFFNGAVMRDVLIDLDEERRRLVWSIVDGPYTHHNGAAQVLDGEEGGSLFVWTADAGRGLRAWRRARTSRGSAVAVALVVLDHAGAVLKVASSASTCSSSSPAT